MQVILLQTVRRLGSIGDVVDVKNGYARNFLIPQEKAIRATKDNLAYFEAERAKIEKENARRKQEAETKSSQYRGVTVTIIRQAGEDGRLFGSVTVGDIARAAEELGLSVDRKALSLAATIKTLGIFKAQLHLHAEVIVELGVNVARSESEARDQLSGKSFVRDRGNRVQEEEVKPAVAAPAAEDAAPAQEEAA